MRLNIVTDKAYSSYCDSYTKLSLAALLLDVLTLCAARDCAFRKTRPQSLHVYPSASDSEYRRNIFLTILYVRYGIYFFA